VLSLPLICHCAVVTFNLSLCCLSIFHEHLGCSEGMEPHILNLGIIFPATGERMVSRAHLNAVVDRKISAHVANGNTILRLSMPGFSHNILGFASYKTGKDRGFQHLKHKDENTKQFNLTTI
jgi:hypothetical protein